MERDTKQGCIPALWNVIGKELGASGQGCLLVMIPLIIGTLRLIAGVWNWEGPVEGVMVWWVVGVFVGAIGLGEGGLKLAPRLRHIGMPIKGIAIGLVIAAATMMIFIAPAMAYRVATMIMIGLGAVFGILGATWFGF